MMDAATGRLMPLAEHVRQSIRNILFTRIGTRIEREEYGSLLPLLIDAPLNEATLLQCNAAVGAALYRCRRPNPGRPGGRRRQNPTFRQPERPSLPV